MGACIGLEIITQLGLHACMCVAEIGYPWAKGTHTQGAPTPNRTHRPGLASWPRWTLQRRHAAVMLQRPEAFAAGSMSSAAATTTAAAAADTPSAPPPPPESSARGGGDDGSMQLLAQGAEARVFLIPDFLGGRPCIVKERFAKAYRLPELDAKLTGRRIVQEVRCMLRCAKAGVRTPCVYMVDQRRSRIYMEKLHGVTLKEFLRRHYDAASGQYDAVAVGTIRRLGRAVARIHDAEVVHGDLTTSNFLVVEEEEKEQAQEQPSGAMAAASADGEKAPKAKHQLVAIDFGLGFLQPLAEDKAVDLYVLERAFLSTHPNSQTLVDEVLAAYAKASNASHSKAAASTAGVLKKLEDVRRRGRKRDMFG